MSCKSLKHLLTLQPRVTFTDVNECRESKDICGLGGLCLNKINRGYDCSCPPGHSGIQDRYTGSIACFDIDECFDQADLCEGPNEECINTIGSYRCECGSTGFVRDNETGNCVDIDECEVVCKGDVAKCTNTIGDFNCSCVTGYQLDTSNSSCIQIG